MVTNIQLRSQSREDINETSSRFLICLHRLATDPWVIAGFAEGHVVGSVVNIDGENWHVTRVTSLDEGLDREWSGKLFFGVSADKAGAVAKADLEREIREALSAYESKMRAAAAELIEVCLQKKASPELLHKILKGDK